jgi:membrane protease YdiL (CAAX protease family)
MMLLPAVERSRLDRFTVMRLIGLTSIIYACGVPIRLLLYTSGFISEPSLAGPGSWGSMVELAFTGLVLAPLIEELIFRLVPYLLYRSFFSTRKYTFAILGFISATVFAATHLTQAPLPVTQFAFGILAWQAVDRYGYRAAVLSHAFYNFMGISVTVLAFAFRW